MSTLRPVRLGVSGVVLLAALLALVFAALSVRQAPTASAGSYLGCGSSGGYIQSSAQSTYGYTCANFYPGCQYGGCPQACNYGSCLQACAAGYAAAGCSLSNTSNCAVYSANPTCMAFEQQYCSSLATSPYGYGGTLPTGCASNYNCGASYSPYGCSVRTPPLCVGTVNTAPQQCAGAGSPAPMTSSCAGTALQACAGGIVVCPGTGQLVSAAQGCSAAPSSAALTATANYQTCPGTGASVTSQSQCTVTCSNGQVLPPGSTCPSSTTTASSGAVELGTVGLKAGWNLASFPAGTQVSGTDAPLYAFPPGSSSYQTLTSSASAPNGQGYWLHVPSATQITLAQVAAGSATIQLPAGQAVLIGNPGDTQATVSGADVVWVYDATAGWTQTTTLNPGQGAFAESAAGGTATITYGAAPGLPS